MTRKICFSPDGDGAGAALYGVNAKKGMALLGNNAKLYVRLLTSFASKTMYEDFLDSLDTADCGVVREKAHALKGVAANLSLEFIYEMIMAIEMDAKNGILITKDDPRLPVLDETYKKTYATIQAIIADPSLLG